MKQLIFVVLVTALAVSMVSAQWTEVQGYRQVGFNGMHFLDTANGWFACNNSLVYRTTDGGRTLQQQTVPPSVGLADLEGVHFLNSQEGWIVGRNAYGGGPGAIIHTTNGGTTWEQQLHYVSNSVWYAVTKVGSAIWVGGGNAHGLILKSTNRGVSWQLTEYSQFGCIATITALDSQRVVINGTKGTLALTTNGGSTWQKANLDTNLQVDKVRFVSKSLGYAIATDFSKNPRFVYLYATVDGGSTWSIRYQWYDAWKPALSVMGDSTIFVGGFTSSASTYSGLLKSTDRGFTWKLEAAFEGTPYQIYTPDDKHGVAAGSGLYYYTPPPPPINHAPGWIFSVPLKIIYGGVTYRWPYQVIDADGDQVRVSVDYTKSPTWVTVDIVPKASL